MKAIIRLVAILVLAISLASCRSDIGVDISIRDDGSGKVAVVVVMDKDIAGQYPEPGELFNTADLRRSGWVVSGPEKTPDGGLKISAEHSFVNEQQARALFNQLGEPFRNLQFSQDRSPFVSSTHFTGDIDLLGGVNSVDDDKVAESLQPILNDPTTASSFEKAVNLEVKISVPGASKTFHPEFGSSTSLDVEGTSVKRTAMFFALAAIFALLSLILGIHIRRHPRRGGKHFRGAPG